MRFKDQNQHAKKLKKQERLDEKKKLREEQKSLGDSVAYRELRKQKGEEL